ncbi:hypothetical protein BCR44DRAFT_43632 [Catenaria anguillulae PL171]|uniref:C2H2-type domain-containing protein n=1 Tax=Catenaria anguillulae PL171 TaxID=765915 RepID=A0A1Y2HA56_9FUNG|nr:hypothetical protein BCR44DRAFT_43632 [Catenaria anguillulae PL171]
MARGKQKEESRLRAEKNKPKEGKSQLKDREKAMNYSCSVCRTACANYKILVQHMEAKHPKSPIPPESS